MSVYFVTCREANAVKIGSSLEPHTRLGELQAYCPLLLTLEAVLPGGTEEEFTFHRRFEDVRIRGEWFTITEMIEAIIAANPVGKRPEKPAPRTIKPDWKDALPKVARARPVRTVKIKGPAYAPHSSRMPYSQEKLYALAIAEMREGGLA